MSNHTEDINTIAKGPQHSRVEEEVTPQLRFPGPSKLFARDESLRRIRNTYKDHRYTQHNDREMTQFLLYVDGAAGCGKSTLIDRFVQELQHENGAIQYARGKYPGRVPLEPLSAISQALSSLAVNIVKQNNPILLQGIRQRLQQVGTLNPREVTILLELVPGLASLLKMKKVKSSPNPNKRDLKQLSYVIGNFLRGFCCAEHPLVLFLDDLQWADPASLELMAYILSETKIPHLIFIGSYRSEDIDDTKAINRHINEIDSKRKINHYHLNNLSLEAVRGFVAETLGLSIVDSKKLSDAIYSKTSGNILHCRHALEELHRKNGIFFDGMVHKRWMFDINSIYFDGLLDVDIITMIQRKINTLSEKAQTLLIIAAHIGNTVDPSIVFGAMKANGYANLHKEEMAALLKEAIHEGLVIKNTHSKKGYIFAHDRVQEAAHKLILSMPKEQQHSTLLRISSVLTAKATCSNLVKDEWMLFVAAHHLNSVPPERTPDQYQLAKLNLRMANLCFAKASFEQAATLLRAAVTRIHNRKLMWVNYYDMCLNLFDRVMETEFALGNYDKAQEAIDEVLNNATKCQHKCNAYHTNIEMKIKVNNMNHAMGIEESLTTLKKLGLDFPAEPTDSQVRRERMKLGMKLQGRSVSCLADLPILNEDWKMRLISQLCHISNLAHSTNLNQYATIRAIRITLETGVSKSFSKILVNYSVPLRIRGNFEEAYSFASVVSKLYERFPEDRDGDYATGQMILHAGILHLKQPFQDSLDALYSTYKAALAAGNVEIALSCGMHYSFVHFTSCLPLTDDVEPKLIQFETKSQQLNQPGFVAIFQYCRQFLHNVQGKADNPTQLTGSVMDEDELLAGLEGKSKKMTLRDLSIFRLCLAYMFGETQTMALMINRLKEYPLFDLPLVRQHLRLVFNGLAALQLGRETGEKEYTKMGQSIMKEVKKLVKVGSANATPAYLCLKAVESHKTRAYDAAIEACQQHGLVLLEAMMNEKCAMKYLEKGKDETAVSYLIRAQDHFKTWGAVAKVNQLETRILQMNSTPNRKCRRYEGTLDDSDCTYYTSDSKCSSTMFGKGLRP